MDRRHFLGGTLGAAVSGTLAGEQLAASDKNSTKRVQFKAGHQNLSSDTSGPASAGGVGRQSHLRCLAFQDVRQ